jgi:hypothetical protein
MIESLISLVILVVIVGMLCLFLSWAMPKLKIPDIGQTIVWVIFGLFALLALLGMFGYGPFQGQMTIRRA